MKKSICLTAAIWLVACTAYSQSTLPGGVSGLKMWLSAERNAGNAVCWTNRLAGNECLYSQSGATLPAGRINYNSSINLDGSTAPFSIPLYDLDLSKTTIFTVYQPADTSGEKCIWVFTGDSDERLVQTDRRVADVRSGRNIPLAAPRSGAALLSTFLQYGKKDSIPPVAQAFRFGQTPGSLPSGVQPFRGKISEMIVYDRVLTGREKQRVESYLALKYGISLSQDYQPTDYLDAKGETIWDAKKAGVFNRNITGFGRDDRSGLAQKQSSSGNTPGLLAIGAGQIARYNDDNKALLPRQCFVIWADNGMDLEAGQKPSGQPAMLMRRWKAQITGAVQDLSTSVEFDTKQSENQPTPAETWWLCMDRSGTGQFPQSETAYYRMDSITAKGTAIFRGVVWSSDRSEQHLFTFGIGPSMMSKVWITPPVCTPETAGVLHLGAEGGRPPYHFTLMHAETGSAKHWDHPDNSVSDIAGIAAGNYTVVIVDADKTRYEEQFFVAGADAPVPQLATQFELKDGETLHLDASEGMPEGLAYQWMGPDGRPQYSPEIGISEPGTYRLLIDRDGCVAQQDIRVLRFAPDNFKMLSLAPNPVASGAPFQVTIGLYRNARVDMDIVDPEGKVLLQRRFEGNNFYRFTESLHVPPGAYVLRFRSEDSVRPLILIVH